MNAISAKYMDNCPKWKAGGGVGEHWHGSLTVIIRWSQKT